jgi:hypothetical protein
MATTDPSQLKSYLEELLADWAPSSRLSPVAAD